MTRPGTLPTNPCLDFHQSKISLENHGPTEAYTGLSTELTTAIVGKWLKSCRSVGHVNTLAALRKRDPDLAVVASENHLNNFYKNACVAEDHIFDTQLKISGTCSRGLAGIGRGNAAGTHIAYALSPPEHTRNYPTAITPQAYTRIVTSRW